MEKSTIPFSETNQFEKIISDYLSGVPGLKKFYKYTPSIDLFAQVIEDRKKIQVNRTLLVDELKRQYHPLFFSENADDAATKKNIQLLGSDNTFTVTTGHQLNIFTGPLYFIYKIITAINLAEKLRVKFPEYNFVPVYWMATEDHDYEEIKSIAVYGKKIAWETNQAGAVGRFKSEGFENLISELENILDKNENSARLISILKKAYAQSNTLADATRSFVHSLFSKFGLVIIDGDSQELKKEMIPLFENEINNQTSFTHVSKTNAEMQMEYGIQVQPREINLFYLSDKSRNRIAFDNNRYIVVGTDISFSKDELLAEIKNNTQCISPNVILRPVYQECILPNIAYIGGPSEVHYWLQFKEMFESFGVFYPMVLLRNCAMLFASDTLSRMQKLRLETHDLFLFTDQLIKKYMHKTGVSEISFDRTITAAEKLFDELSAKVSLVDGSLKQTVDAEKAKFFNSLKNVQAKVTKAQKSKEEQNLNQIAKLRDKYFPSGSMQEREENILQYIAKYGFLFIDDLIAKMEPVPKEFLMLEL